MPALKLHPYWWDPPVLGAGIENREPRAENPEPPSLPSRVDVAVVGAGYTGLAAARELARGGASVLVIERERVGWGASSRNAGQVLTGLKLDPATLVARFGEARARVLFDVSLASIASLEHLIAEETIECDYERCGHIQAAAKPSHFEGFRAEQSLLASVFKHRVELVPPSEQHRELGSDVFFGLMVDERSCAIHPARFVEGLRSAAVRAGAAVADRTSVSRLTRAGGHWMVTTDRGVVESAEVLVATNGYTDQAAPWLRRRLIPIGSYIVVTEPLPSVEAARLLPGRRTAFDSKHFLHYFRLTPDRRLLFGGRAEFGRPTPDAIARCAEILRRDMIRIFPSLSSVALEYAWGGNVAFTRDQLPHAGRLGDAYYAGGYCGHGIAMATLLGTSIGRRIAGRALEQPLFDDRFPAIPLYRGTPWFLPLAGAYYRLLDWIS